MMTCEPCNLRASHWPWCTLVLIAVTLVAAMWPEANAWLTFDRSAIEAGEIWRILTGHITHWSMSHLFWDGLALIVLGTVAERQGRWPMLICTVGSALVISAGVWWAQPELSSYRGLSGIDSALFVLAATALLRGALQQRETWQSLFAGTCLVVFVMRTCLEWWLGEPLFVDSSASGFIPVPLAHVLGGLVGVVVGLWPTRFTLHDEPASRTATSAHAGDTPPCPATMTPPDNAIGNSPIKRGV